MSQKRQNRIFVNGSFDILHAGHIELLNYAKSLGGPLLVAIDSDERITQSKGKDRPFNNQYNRLMLMQNLKAVDRVVLFDSDEGLEKIIREYAPDIMVKGSDYEGQPIIGKEYCKDIIFFKRHNGESTTKTIQNYLDRR